MAIFCDGDTSPGYQRVPPEPEPASQVGVVEEGSSEPFLRKDLEALQQAQQALPNMDVVGALVRVISNPQTALGLKMDDQAAAMTRAAISSIGSGYIQFKAGGIARRIHPTVAEPVLAGVAHGVLAFLALKVFKP